MTINHPMTTRFFVIALIILNLFICSQAQTKKRKRARWNWQKHETETIDYARKYPVSNLDPKLPQISFEKWFQATVGETAQIDWDVNDCGEQTGTSAGRGRDFPLCVGAETVKAGFIHISVDIQFGTFNRGITKMKPVVRSITAGDEIGGEWLDKLSDLPKALESHEKTPNYINPNGGAFEISGKPPAGFEKISGMRIQTMDYDAKGKYVWVTANGGIQVGQIFYKFQDVIFSGEIWNFETIRIGGVSYKFEGKFAKLKFDPNGLVLGENVLHGNLIKLVEGTKTAEADLSFNFIREFICKDCDQSGK